MHRHDREWIDALDRIEALNPGAVVASHKRPENEDDPRIVEQTRLGGPQLCAPESPLPKGDGDDLTRHERHEAVGAGASTPSTCSSHGCHFARIVSTSVGVFP